MLDFLDAFCRALAARDPLEIRRLLRLPLARMLPPTVRAEARAIARAGRRGRLSPTRAFHFYYQTLQLLTPSAPSWPATDPGGPGRPSSRAGQLATTR
jgi:hypothetical protein